MRAQAVGVFHPAAGDARHDLPTAQPTSQVVEVVAGPKTVAARLGDTVAVAMSIYAHLFPDEDQDTREAVEDFLSEAA
ncbi:hypothetical protein AQI70_33310 [Streptomyces curacoi]|uniref:Uncharacterized protein n=1 Tax=Streptomyces curacoi TaxID=146536 RepID=A0A124GVI8_9ACTN|nr:hypothetical protein AQI70_33310 [Streptomyces curacoi]